MTKLSTTQASACINDSLAPFLSNRKLRDLNTLLAMAKETGEISLAPGMFAIAPGKSRKQRSAVLQWLCDGVEEASRLSGVFVVLKYDKGKPPKQGIDHRQIWFEGDIAAGELAQRNAARAAKTAATLKSKAKFEGGKQIISYFVMWSQAREPKRQAEDLLMRVRRHLMYAKNFSFVEWSAEHIDIGAPWHEHIQEAISKSDLALILISPEFLGSRYIKEFELPKYIASDGGTPAGDKIAVPVALMPFNMDRNQSELLGLEHRQIFFGDSGGRAIAYSQCRSLATRDEFALELAKRILQLLEQKFGS
jgi:hypothetical protein